MSTIKADQYIDKNKKNVNPEYRNEFHLMAPIGWMNDPNGFIFYKGQYHLFYQFYPYDSIWGPMHWGHAVSDDGVHWQDLPTALAPDQDYDRDGCFSGTAYVEDDILYLMYTGHVVEEGVVRQVQCLAKSEDGIHFEKLKENPVIHEEHIEGLCSIQDFRDPKLFKREGRYYSIVAANTEDKRGQLLIFESENMLDWSKGKVFLEGQKDQGIMWECPDVFELDGKDVIIMSPIQMKQQGYEYSNISSTLAMIGSIDWETLTYELETFHEIDRGLDFYAPQSALNPQGKRVITAWMQMWDRRNLTHELGHQWSGSMTLPREVKIEDNRFVQSPLSSIYDQFHYETVDLEAKEGFQSFADNPQYIHAVLNQESFKMHLAEDGDEYLLLSYQEGILTLSREKAGYAIWGNEGDDYHSRSIELESDHLALEIFIDVSSIEVFINQKMSMSMTFYKKKTERKASIQGLEHASSFKIGVFQ